jgi:tryptophan synthase alpha chain
MSGRSLTRIEEVFVRSRSGGRAALMPYLPLGYPTLAHSLELVEAAVANGADMIELGIPFSDPLADGPVIQAATQVALDRGMTLSRCIDAVRTLRHRGIHVPLLLMGYTNPILAYGPSGFGRDCADVGVDGLIVPDLPPEEGGALEQSLSSGGVSLTYLLAPTSTEERIDLITGRSEGFVYLVSVTGVTGAREQLPPSLGDFVKRTRAHTDKPLAVGFGISNPQQARSVASIADGVIVGSAIVRLSGGSDSVRRVGEFVRSMRQAVARRP